MECIIASMPDTWDEECNNHPSIRNTPHVIFPVSSLFHLITDALVWNDSVDFFDKNNRNNCNIVYRVLQEIEWEKMQFTNEAG